ncbi:MULTISPECIES: hypothetical protein [Niastella]|uniref:DUF1640 domain-containing protein n=1 Tax=Niastella soli TaxID=2821487 RepID=A0ABS3YXT4_9BACT|nr:hypothetical protein [Niastella soli]MBO9202644.1 hypothetical protein [Niastella soli]
MEISQIRMYELFKSKLGDKEAEAFVHLIEEKMDAKINQRTQLLATKDDIAALRNATKDDIAALRNATKDDIAALRDATKDDIAALRDATKDDIAALRDATKDEMRKWKDDLLRTIFLTSLGQLLAIVTAVISIILVTGRK